MMIARDASPRPRAVIVAPCYKEARWRDDGAFLAALSGLPGVEFLFVDSSTDQTRQRLKALAARVPDRIAVLALERIGGKADDVRRGMLAAMERNASFLGFYDADLALPLHTILDMLRLSERMDRIAVIFGSRRAMLGHRIHRDRPCRVVSRICNLMARMALGIPVVALALWQADAAGALGLTHATLLPILAGALPFAAPLCLARGVALGLMTVTETALSTQVEMVVRLGLGALAWQAGWGIEGVALAVALSIVAGWVVLARGVALAALPFALLQVAQGILLDGEVILARLWLGPEDSGHAAALALFQRIAFFACFGLVSVLLPMVAGARSRGEGPGRTALSVMLPFAAVSLPWLAAATLLPAPLVRLVVGAEFLPAAPLLLPALAAAVAFTASYLLASGVAAAGDRAGIAPVALRVPVPLAAITWASAGSAGLSDLIAAKRACHLVLLVALCWCALRLARSPDKRIVPMNNMSRPPGVISPS